MNRRKISRKRKKLHSIIVVAFTAFFVFVSILASIILKNEIIKADSEIIALEAKVEAVKKENDNLEGELLAKQDLDYIEKVASKQLGMVRSKAKNGKIVSLENTVQTEVSSSDVSQQGGSEENKAANLFTWISQIIQ